MVGDLLYIWDESASQLEGGPHEGATERVGVSSTKELFAVLDALVAAKKTFSRVLIQTHGKSGAIRFGDNAVHYIEFLSDWAGKGYHQLFPYVTTIYFDGCNVADGEEGWKFLEYSGKVLLKMAGGFTLGWTSLGVNLWSWMPYFGGHTVHLWGDWRNVQIFPGGVVGPRWSKTDQDEVEARERRKTRLNVGNKI